MESIEDIAQEIKQKYRTKENRLHDVIIAFIILTVGISSFGLGYLAAKEAYAPSVYIREGDSTMTAASYAEKQQRDGVSTEGRVVGSIHSDRYHLEWCSGAQRIAEENKIYFDSEKEAQAAGYQPAGNCPGIGDR